MKNISYKNIILLSVFLSILALGFAYLLSSFINSKQINSKITTQDVEKKYVSDIPADNFKPTPHVDTPIAGEFREVNVLESLAIFNSPAEDLLTYDPKALKCIDVYKRYSSNEFKKWLSNEKIEGLIHKLEDYEFSDQYESMTENGIVTIYNEGLRSKKNILYNTFCKNNDYYFVLFITENIPGVSDTPNADYGGGWEPQASLLVFNDQIFKVYEYIPDNSKRIEVKRPENWGMPYYSCRQLLGTYGQNVIFTCGGGDGPGGGVELYELNLSNNVMVQKAFCWNMFGETSCHNEKGERYFYTPSTEEDTMYLR